MITVSKKGFPRKSEVDKKISRMIHNKNLIYCFFFPGSGKMYFGQTQNFWNRMSTYRTAIKSEKLEKEQSKLYNAIHKYDYMFTVTVVAIDIHIDELDDVETSYIDMFDSFKNGYNMTGGGKVLRGDKSPMFGKTHTDETRAQMSESRMGDPRPKSEEWCQEHSEKMKGENNPRRIKSIQTHAQRGIDITLGNIKIVFEDQGYDLNKTAKQIGCALHIIKAVCERSGLIQKTE